MRLGGHRCVSESLRRSRAQASSQAYAPSHGGPGFPVTVTPRSPQNNRPSHIRVCKLLLRPENHYLKARCQAETETWRGREAEAPGAATRQGRGTSGPREEGGPRHRSGWLSTATLLPEHAAGSQPRGRQAVAPGAFSVPPQTPSGREAARPRARRPLRAGCSRPTGKWPLALFSLLWTSLPLPLPLPLSLPLPLPLPLSLCHSPALVLSLLGDHQRI